MMNFMINMLKVEVCSKGFDGFCTGIVAFLVSLLYGLLQLVCKLVGTFVDLLNIAFYIFAGVDFGDGRFNIQSIATGEKMNILDYFVFNESVTKAYFNLVLIAVVLVVIFTVYKIVKQDYFDRAGPRSKGPIFRNVAISCISFMLVIPIFYLIIHASSFLAVQVYSAMGMNINTYAGMQVFQLSWSDGGKAMHEVNNMLGGTDSNAGSMWYLESNLLFTLLADGEYVSYDPEIMKALNMIGTNEEGEEVLLEWAGPLSTMHKPANINGQEIQKYTYYTNFYWYIYFVAVIVALKAMWNLVLAMIQRIFKLMGLFIVAPAPISQYVLDDGAKYKQWLEKSIQEGLRLVVACMSFAIFLLALGVISDINFASAFKTSMTEASGGRAEILANINVSTLAYEGEFASLPTNVGVTGGTVTSIEEFAEAYGCKVKNVIYIDGGYYCGPSFFESLINAFLQCLLIVSAGGAIKDLDPVLSPLISGAGSSLDSGSTGAAANAVGKAALSVAGAAAGGVFAGAVGAVKNAGAGDSGAAAGEAEEEKDAKSAEPETPQAGAPTEGGPSAPTEGGPGGAGGEQQGDGEQSDDANAPGGDGGNGDGPGDDDEGASDDANAPGGDGDNGAEGEEKGDGAEGEEKGDGAGEGNGAGGEGNGTGGEAGKGGNGTAAAGKGKGKKAGATFDKTKLEADKKKNVVGKVVKGAGKIGLRAAKVPLNAAFRGVMAGLKTAAGTLATAAVGETIAKSFMNSKKEVDQKEATAAAKRYQAGKDRGFRNAREDRIKRAEQQAEAANAEYTTQAAEEAKAVAAENGAVQDLNAAEAACAAAEAGAADANASILVKDKEFNAAQETVTKNESQIAEAETKNKAILKEAGVDSVGELDTRIALLDANDPERKKLEGLRSKFTDEGQIKQWRDSADAGRATMAQRAKKLDTITGRDGRLTALGLSAADTKSLESTKGAISSKIASCQATLDDANATPAAKAEAKKKMEQLTAMSEELGDYSEADAHYFDGATTQKARIQNEKAVHARAKVKEAQSAYQTAHKATQKATAKKAEVVDAYEKSHQFAKNLTETEGFSSHTKETAKFTPDGKGGVVKTGFITRARENHRSHKFAAEAKGAVGADKVLERKVTGNVDTPQGEKQLLSACRDHVRTSYDTAAESFETAMRSAGISDEDIKAARLTKKTPGLNHSQFNVAKAREKIQSSSIPDDKKQELLGKLGEYEVAKNTYHHQTRTLGQIDTVKESEKVTKTRIDANIQRGQVLAGESAVLQQIIASGGNIQLTPQMVRLMNTVPGAHITASSPPSDVMAAARSARQQRLAEQVTIARESDGLTTQRDELRSSLRNMIGGLADDINGTRGNGANQPRATQQQVQNNTNQTIINNYGTAPGNGTGMEGVLSSIRTPDQMSDSAMDKAQTELIRANQELLQRVKEQNKEILDIVEDIERALPEE